MANSRAKAQKQAVGIAHRFPAYVGYADHFLKTEVPVQIRNGGAEPLSLTVRVFDEAGLVLPYETQIEIPFESTVELTLDGIFSPLFLAENDAERAVTVHICALSGEAELARCDAEVTALPFDVWEGLSGNPERLAAYLRPRVADCARMLEETGKRLKRWNADREFLGYTGADKNAVRQVSAALYAAFKGMNIEREGDCDLTRPTRAAGAEAPSRTRRAGALEAAVFLAACLESARLHPVLALGEHAVSVGVWLYDTCFLDSVTDDCDLVGNYITEGINNLSFFDVEDIFASENAGFTSAEGHFAQKLRQGYFEYFVDIRRCRLAGITPMPVRGKGLHGMELVREEELSGEEAPAPLIESGKLGLEGKQARNRQWERRLLDLTAKNALLNFTGKRALHLHCADVNDLYDQLLAKGSMRLKAGAEPAPPFGADYTPQQRELLRLEQRKGILRAFPGEESVAETAVRLVRRNREAAEETGTRILYLAFGFLRYVGREDASPKYAPLVLAPVGLKRGKGNEEYAVEYTEGEYFVNTTLLEYLKQEFNVDMRLLGDDVSKHKISELINTVLAEVATLKGWTVERDVYLASFSFQRYLMWNDLRNHFDALKQNAVVSALLNGRAERAPLPKVQEEDEGDPLGTLIPLPADSSQYSAIALSRTGTSFVLHGPPGTGKSQTITNIIANALEDGKRVLFVAEKKAALDVVKKRLDGIGIGEFCLELHSNKTDKSDVLRRLEGTLALAAAQPACDLSAQAREIATLRDELRAPMLALHKKRRLGISVYDAILTYLNNREAPDILDIESSFYDALTKESLAECRSRILSAASAAKECGGVVGSPFENVNVAVYSQAFRDKVFCACEVILTEIKHLKSYLALFLEFYRQKLSTITRRKLENLCTLARGLTAGAYDRYFSSVTEEQFYVFYNANRRLDERLNAYYRHFKSLVLLEKDEPEVRRVLERGGDWMGSKPVVSAVKRLSRVCLHDLPRDDATEYLHMLLDIHEAMARVKSIPLAQAFCDRSGDIVFKRRAEFLRELYDLHEMCAKTFMDYNADAFNGMCIRAQNGYTRPVLEGYLKAYDAFCAAEESFLSVTRGDRNKIPSEDILDYFSSKAGALIENIDMLPNWCMYRATGERLREIGCSFISDALESGRLTGENVLSGFEKNVCKNFLEINIPADPDLSRMTAGSIEDTIDKFRTVWEDFTLQTRTKIRSDLIARIPAQDGEGPLSVELAAFTRLAKGNLRGMGLRALFAEVPELIRRIAPCMLMSPVTAAQYLEPRADLFDLVIFDEASQMSTAEAVGSIARAKAAIIVGDPKQLPPTAFFRSAYVDEENLENEDLESVLDDCLALGMPERHLLWHYRSKHESLIAFSNSMYYDNRLCTFPSPDAMESKVKLCLVDGTYDRGFTKRNRKEAEALVREVVRRLADPVLSRASMGIVTFSSAQQSDIERLLSKEILKRKLEGAAYDREEPLFVKNLENVQGDERDVILFSVCYGPDSTGRVSLNFGPLNQAGGWRRLNVAVSRAREEMLVFASMTSASIDVSKTSSRGVQGLKAFLEFAEKGRTTLAVRPDTVKGGAGIGKFVAEELAVYGYECRCDVGTSDFKIDVAVIDPKDPHRFILAVLFDATDKFSVKDRAILQVQTLKRGNWNVIRVNCVNYYNNPKREIKRIKDLLDKITGAEKKGNAWLLRAAKPYRSVKQTGGEVAAFVTSGVNDAEIAARLKQIVATEEPISRPFLRRRCLATFGILKSGARVEACLDALIDSCAFRRERVMGCDYFYKNDRAIELDAFRTEGEPVLRKAETDFTPFEIVAFIRCALEERVSLYIDEIFSLLAGTLPLARPNEKFALFVRDCIAYGEEKGVLVRSVSDRVSLA